MILPIRNVGTHGMASVHKDASEAIVFECKGGAEGALSVVRTLGREGVSVYVITDDEASLSAQSRYCRGAYFRTKGHTRETADDLATLRDLASQLGNKPVVFPTADPDLLLLSRLRDQVSPVARLFLAQPEIVDALSDKRRFIDFAERYKLPVPKTWAPQNQADAVAASREARYPVVLKPSNPLAWTAAPIRQFTGPRKALVTQNASELMQAWDAIAPHNADMLMQEYIAGPDESHYSLHAYLDRNSKPLAWFTGRKVRVYPAYAGSGCFVESVYVEPMVEIGLRALTAMNYTGIAVINFKQDARTGEFVIHEINPRVSQWNILATRCGVNIPYIAYADTTGLAVPEQRRQREGVRYVNLRCDLKAFAAYRKRGDWSLARYLYSLRPPLVHQVLASDDPGVPMAVVKNIITSRTIGRAAAEPAVSGA